MTGAELLTFVKRRLAEAGLTVEAERTAELYDHITQARDDVKRELAIEFPSLFATAVELEVDGSDDRIYSLPAATGDPIAMQELREKDTGEAFDPSPELNKAAGDYAFLSPRSIRLADHTDEGEGVEFVGVFQGTAIDENTAAADIGIPTPTHRAIGLGAAVLALTVDEESDASMTSGLYERELSKLKDMYGNFDKQGGMQLRNAFMKSIGDLHGDTIY